MKTWHLISFVVLVGLACRPAPPQESLIPDFQAFSGPYFGQQPPQNTARLFMPGTISTFGRNGNITFLDDGKFCIFTSDEAGTLFTYLEDGRWSDPQPLPWGRKRGLSDYTLGGDGKTFYWQSAKPTDEKDTVSPSINKLQAFRVTDRGACALTRAIKEAGITLLPNYEIHIDSLFYPARQLNRLMELCDVEHEDTHTVLKLAKKKVILQHAADTGLDVIDLFKELGIRAIPENVAKELAAWAGHADNFVLYQGFGLMEGNMDKNTASRFAAVSIAADAHIVRQSGKLFEHLEQAHKVPVYVKHSDHAFKSLGDTVQSKFSAKKRAKKSASRKKRKFTLKRTVHLILEFPDKAMFEAFTNAILDKGYALDTNKQARTVSYSQKDEAIIKDVLNSLKKNFHAVIKNA